MSQSLRIGSIFCEEVVISLTPVILWRYAPDQVACCPLALPSSTVTSRGVQRTHTEEFYELYDGELEMAPLSLCAP